MFNFTNSYLNLSDKFYQKIKPALAPNPKLVLFNDELFKSLKIDDKNYSEEELAQVFSGKKLLSGSDPIAQVYSGHQFGHFSPILGDGRAHLLGEIETPQKQKFEIQLKGSGRTQFSRRGDGKATLGPMLREYLVSEAMFNLNIPTTRSLAVVTTGEDVWREKKEPGAVLTRVAFSHLRVGHFEYFASQNDLEGLKELTQYAISKLYPELLHLNQQEQILSFFKAVCERQLHLVAQWLSVGFIHGVMNTDNTSISGETIDYGPCAFMDHFNFNQVYSSIDSRGRYSYNQQKNIIFWNLKVLASCLLPLINEDFEKAVQRIEPYLQTLENEFETLWLKTFAAKLGFQITDLKTKNLIDDFLNSLHSKKFDFILSFKKLETYLDANLMSNLSKTAPKVWAELNSISIDEDWIQN